MIALLAGHFREMVRQVKDLKLRTGTQRLASFLLQLVDDATGVGNQRNASRGELQPVPAATPGKDRCTDRAIEVRDRLRHRRLRQLERDRGAAQAPVLDDREQRAQLPDIKFGAIAHDDQRKRLTG
jgi:hypothetical protein